MKFNKKMIAPETEESKIDVVEEPLIWTSCCLRIDKQATIYFSQLFMSIFVLTFCFYQLVSARFDCNQGAPYWGAISMVLGLILGRSSRK